MPLNVWYSNLLYLTSRSGAHEATCMNLSLGFSCLVEFEFSCRQFPTTIKIPTLNFGAVNSLGSSCTRNDFLIWLLLTTTKIIKLVCQRWYNTFWWLTWHLEHPIWIEPLAWTRVVSVCGTWKFTELWRSQISQFISSSSSCSCNNFFILLWKENNSKP